MIRLITQRLILKAAQENVLAPLFVIKSDPRATGPARRAER
jgi:hypothetical protein